MDRFAQVNGIRLHYLDYNGGQPALIFLPGLSANAHAFDGVMAAGLSPQFRVISLDLRGRGLSDKPASGYSMAEHAADVIALLDALGIERAVVCGHSFGGLLTIYLASHFPARVAKAVIIDAGVGLITPQTRDLIQPSLDRLGKVAPSWEAYLEAMKRAPHFDGWWDPQIESYFRADVQVNEDGTVESQSRPENIAEAIEKAALENWDAHAAAIEQPAMLLHARGACGPPGAPALIPLELAEATTRKIAHCRYYEIAGNHYTMVYGAGARQLVERVSAFVCEPLSEVADQHHITVHHAARQGELPSVT